MSRFWRRDFWIVFGLSCLWVFLSPLALCPELVLRPSAVTTLDQPSANLSDVKNALPLLLTDRLILADETGNYRSFPAGDGLSIGQGLFAQPSPDAASVALYGFDGARRLTIPYGGYPLFVGPNLFIAAKGGNFLRALNARGELRWQRYFHDPVVHVANLPNDLTAVQLVGGDLVVIGPNGHLLSRWANRRSELSVGLGLVAVNGTLYVYNGIRPQLFQILEWQPSSDGSGGNLIENNNFDFGTDFRREVLMQGLAGAQLVLVENPNGLTVVGAQGDVVRQLNNLGFVVKIQEDTRHQLLYVAANTPNGRQLYALNRQGLEVFRFGPFKNLQDFAVSFSGRLALADSDRIVVVTAAIQ